MNAARTIQIEQYPDREAWLAARRRNYGVGASDIGKILGVAPARWGGPWSVWASHRAPELLPARSASEQAILDEGTDWERDILAHWSRMYGVEVEHFDHAIVRHPKHSWALVSLDGWDGRIVEVKTDRKGGRGFGEDGTVIGSWDDGAELLIPPEYALQGYFGLEITGASEVVFVVAVPRSFAMPEIRTIHLLRDEATQAAIMDEVAAWRERHLIDGVPPEVDGSATARRWLVSTTPPPDKVILDADDKAEALLATIRDAREIAQTAEAREEAAKTELLGIIGAHKGIVGAAGKLTRSRVAGRRTLSLGDVEQHADILALVAERGLIKTGDPGDRVTFTAT